MAIGDQSDMMARLQAWMPNGWVPLDPASAPISYAVLWGGAHVLSFFYGFFVYIRQQTRLLSATDGWLDMIAGDFFGTALQRGVNQSDFSFRAAILINMFRERGTRAGMAKVMQDVTGVAPVILEPTRPADTGSYGGGAGYAAAGGYGSLGMPYQALVVAELPLTMGIPLANGYGAPAGGYGQASQALYGNQALMAPGADAQAAIFAAADNVRPIGTMVWVAVTAGSLHR